MLDRASRDDWLKSFIFLNFAGCFDEFKVSFTTTAARGDVEIASMYSASGGIVKGVNLEVGDGKSRANNFANLADGKSERTITAIKVADHFFAYGNPVRKFFDGFLFAGLRQLFVAVVCFANFTAVSDNLFFKDHFYLLDLLAKYYDF